MNYDTILVPLDGSERAEVILSHVENLARHYHSRVILLEVLEPVHTVVSPDGIYIPDQEVFADRKKASEDYLTQIQNRLKNAGIDVTCQLVVGRVVDQIINVAEQENADLVAMASHGRTGLARVFYGSVAAGVLHRIERPLLLVRSN